MQNHGYIHTSIPTSAQIYGGREVEYVVPDRNWKPFLPEFESQLGKDFETMACVTFSALNCIETTIKQRIDSNANFSDRFTAKMSGTTNRGNTLWNVMRSISEDGYVQEATYPNDAKSFLEYYKDIPQDIVIKGKNALLKWGTKPEFVPTDADIIYDALGHAPIQIAMYAYAPTEIDDIHARTTKPPTHAIMICNAVEGKYFELFDHYNKDNPFVKVAWDSLFWGAVIYNIKQLPNMQFKENQLIQLVSDEGGFYMFKNERLLKLETFEHALAWLVRNGSEFHKNIVAVNKADLEGFEIWDFKGNKLANHI